ncbi:MAG: endo alpha-1,4 polygalactosaminidase, partial [Candidatus Aureabacteria bacterium]|nr:endo alpha-1,4 polygalactosaminidase [Candidatus Auribacterota bacterium]
MGILFAGGAALVLLLIPDAPAQDRLTLSSADYDGDGTAEIAVFRPSSGFWRISDLSVFAFGEEEDLPVSGDYDGNGTAEAAVFRPSQALWAARGLTRFVFGEPSDTPVAADYDGNGTAAAAVYRPSSGAWVVRNLTRFSFGSSGDIPVPGDWRGNGEGTPAVFRPSSGLWAARNATRLFFGITGDVPLPFRWPGKEADTPTVFRPSAGLWASPSVTRFFFGSGADWALALGPAHGPHEPAVFRPASALWAIRGGIRKYFGSRGDFPAAGNSGRVHAVRLSEVRYFAYNIMNVNTSEQREQLVGSHFDMYVLEPVVTEKGEESFDIAGLVRDIRNYVIANYHKNPIILAYSDVGQAEDWRWYWQSGWGVGNPSWIISADPDGWSGCYPVAYWYPAWQDIAIYGSGGNSQVGVTLENGFDGIYMDWIDGFSDEQVVARAQAEGVDPAEAMFDFIGKIRSYAREGSPIADAGYLVVAQNAPGLYGENPSQYLSLIDAISQEGIWYEGDGGFDDWDNPRGYNVPTDEIYPGWTEELLEYLAPMKGFLPIFCIEYAQDAGGLNRASEVYSTLALGEGFIPYCTRRVLSRLSTTPYP